MTRTRSTVAALLVCALLGSGGSSAAIATATARTRLVACPDGQHRARAARVVARRPGAVIYEVRAGTARAFVAACSGSTTWEPRTPTRFG
jgi:hypothetical protein